MNVLATLGMLCTENIRGASENMGGGLSTIAGVARYIPESGARINATKRTLV